MIEGRFFKGKNQVLRHSRLLLVVTLDLASFYLYIIIKAGTGLIRSYLVTRYLPMHLDTGSCQRSLEGCRAACHSESSADLM